MVFASEHHAGLYLSEASESKLCLDSIKKQDIVEDIEISSNF